MISVDEKPSFQALERATGYVENDNGKIVRGCKSTYKRHGTLNLFAALQVVYRCRITVLEKLHEDLDENDDVQQVFSNEADPAE